MITHQIYAMSKIPGFKTLYLLGFYEEATFTAYMKNIEKTLGIKCKYLALQLTANEYILDI